MLKRKDNLTDLVEQLPNAEEPTSDGHQEVVNNEGETVILGQKPTSTTSPSTNRNSLELSGTAIQDIKDALRSAFRKALDSISPKS